MTKEPRRVGHWNRDLEGTELENLVKGLSRIIYLAEYSQRYRPIKESELITAEGKALHSWLREIVLRYSPFGISYIHENQDKPKKKIQIELSAGKTIETILQTTAGIYALYHSADASVYIREVGLVAFFKDLIKVYSLKSGLPPRWDDLGVTFQKRAGNNTFEGVTKYNKPIIYAYTSEGIFEQPIIQELSHTDFTCYIDTINSKILLDPDKCLH